MIAITARARLTRSDVLWLTHALSRSDGSAISTWEDRIAAEGLDRWLGDPRAIEALGTSALSPSFALWCCMTVADGFRYMGLVDRDLEDYIAAILWEFHLPNRAHRMQRVDDRTWDTLAELSLAAEHLPKRESVVAQAHVGNLAMWMTGLFPDQLWARHGRRGAPPLSYYVGLGKSGWLRASYHATGDAEKLGEILARGADEYQRVRLALSYMGDRHWFRRPMTGEVLWRQSEDAMNASAIRQASSLGHDTES